MSDLSRDQKKTAVTLSVISFVLLLAAYTQIGRFHDGYRNDFLVYYRASTRILAGDWSNIYTLADGAFPFRYFPACIPFFAPLALMPESLARVVWALTQTVFFVGGYAQILKTLRFLGFRRAPLWTLFSFIGVLRFDSDALYCGQIAGILFFLFASTFRWTVEGRFTRAGLFLLPATALKVGPGLGYILLLLRASGRERLRAALTWAAVTAAFSLPILSLTLWNGWLQILANDGGYYDGANEKSQALRSFFLRVISAPETAEWAWKMSVLLGVTGLVFHWWKVHREATPENAALTRAFSFTGVIYGFIFWMPQSLPYAWVHLAIPISLLFASQEKNRSNFTAFALIVFAACASFPGRDLIGFEPARWVERMSLPLFALFGLSLATYLQAPKKQIRS